MNRFIKTALIAAVCTLGVTAQAQDKTRSAPSGQEKPGGGTSAVGAPSTSNNSGMAGGDHSSMDSNNDGFVSRAEWMKHHEMMWGKMKKNPKGMVSAADMMCMPQMGDAQPNSNPK